MPPIPEIKEFTSDLSSESGDEAPRSPLWMLTREQLLNDLISYLDAARIKLTAKPHQPHHLIFSQRNLTEVRQSFRRVILAGEERLHKLCELFCKTYCSSYTLQSVVIGEIPSTHERFTLTQPIASEALYSITDLDLGNRQLQKIRFVEDQALLHPVLVANMVEYQPLERNQFTIHRLISRIKAEEEIFNKIVDEIFDLDSLVRRDKKLRPLSRYVKDVFGLKFVVGLPTDVACLHDALRTITWTAEDLDLFDIPYSEETNHLEFLEVKNYLGKGERKQSGWEAVKSVVRWGDKMFEIQIQPIHNFFEEREVLTRHSHHGFKAQRESVRNEVANELPLFRFYRDLLKWLFHEEDAPCPSFKGVQVILDD